jgi:hypothetical protein
VLSAADKDLHFAAAIVSSHEPEPFSADERVPDFVSVTEWIELIFWVTALLTRS